MQTRPQDRFQEQIQEHAQEHSQEPSQEHSQEHPQERSIKQSMKGALPFTETIVNADNWVTVRVWKAHVGEEISSAKKAIKAHSKNKESNVGHVSIETTNMYASFWPDIPPTGLKSITPGHHMSAVADDVASEDDKQPDVCVTLYSLNVSALELFYADFKKEDRGWTIKGSNYFRHEGQSCSGLAYDLLKAGNIEHLAGASTSLKFVTTPNAIADLVEAAKKRELIKHSETKDYPAIRTAPANVQPISTVQVQESPALSLEAQLIAEERSKREKLERKLAKLKLKKAYDEGRIAGLQERVNNPQPWPSMPYSSVPFMPGYPPMMPSQPYGYNPYGFWSYPTPGASMPMPAPMASTAPVAPMASPMPTSTPVMSAAPVPTSPVAAVPSQAAPGSVAPASEKTKDVAATVVNESANDDEQTTSPFSPIG